MAAGAQTGRRDAAAADPAGVTRATVRPARSDDARFLAQAMYESMLPQVGRGVFDGPLEGAGVEPVEFHEAMLLSGASNWGQLQDFLVLDLPEAPRAAAAAAYRPGADLRPLTPKGFEAAAARLAWPPEVGREFWRRYISAFGPFGQARQLAQPADYVIEYVWVRPELRGRGLVGALLRAHAERARGSGCSSVGISATLGNEAALRAYRKCGFREHLRLGPELYRGGFPGAVRLVLELGRES